MRPVLISVCADPTIVARAPAYTRAYACARRTRVLRARWKNYKKNCGYPLTLFPASFGSALNRDANYERAALGGVICNFVPIAICDQFSRARAGRQSLWQEVVIDQERQIKPAEVCVCSLQSETCSGGRGKLFEIIRMQNRRA